jgi:chromosome segregation ATPase
MALVGFQPSKGDHRGDLMPAYSSDQDQMMLAEKLEELEGRVRLVVALVAKLKGEKVVLEQRIEELQVAIKARVEQVGALEAARKKDQEQLIRMLEEREEVRLKVDRLLEEIARIEASVESGA